MIKHHSKTSEGKGEEGEGRGEVLLQQGPLETPCQTEVLQYKRRR